MHFTPSTDGPTAQLGTRGSTTSMSRLPKIGSVQKHIIAGATEVGTGKPKEDDMSALSKVIDLINERSGTDFTEGDRRPPAPGVILETG